MSGFYYIDKAYKTFLDDNGISGELVFKKAGLSLKSLEFEEGGLTLNREQYIAWMESLDELTEDRHILSITSTDQLVMFNPPLFAAMCSRNGNNCIDRISQYKKLMGPFAMLVTRDATDLHIDFVFDENRTKIPRFTILTEQTLVTGILRRGTGKHIIPKRVTSIYDYGTGELKEFFGVTPQVSDRNTLSFSLKDMEEPFLTANNTMWEFLEPELKKRIKEMEMDETFSAKVRSILVELIPAGDDSIDSVAKELAVSARTLQRKLSEERTTFIQQLNQTRELMARNYMKDRSISNDEIAFLVGYSDANAFGRAFRGWTGMTVGAYRKQLIAS